MRFDPLLFLFLAGTSLFLVVDHIYLAVPVVLAISGLVLRWMPAERAALPYAVQQSWRRLLVGFAGFVVSVVFLNLFHGDLDLRNFERVIPFVLLPAVGWVILARDWDVRHWLVAVGVGCCLAFAAAIHDTYVLMSIRAMGATSNYISFGHISVVMGTICAIAAATFPRQDGGAFLRPFLAIAALCAVCASLLSGSKGGWASLGLVALLACGLATAHMPFWKRVLTGFACLGIIGVIAMLAPAHIVSGRILSGLHGAIGWFDSGAVAEFSVSVRFELWKLGLQLAQEAPLFGLGTHGLALRWSELTASGASFSHLADFRTVDNEFLGAMAEGGLIGALGYYGVYAGAFAAFWPWRNHADGIVRCLALTGLILVPVHLLFGLSVSVLGISMFRTEFVTFMSSLLAFLSLRVMGYARQSSANGTSRVVAEKR